MNIQVTGRKVVVTQGLRGFVEGRLAKLEDIYPKARKASVVLTVEKYRHTAEVHFHAEKVEMSAKKTTKDMYASIEGAVAALEHQASKRKEALRSQHSQRRRQEKVSTAVSRRKPAAERWEAEEGVKAKLPPITRIRSEVKPLDLEDAVAELKDRREPFLGYRDARTDRPCVLWRREDGSLALLEL